MPTGILGIHSQEAVNWTNVGMINEPKAVASGILVYCAFDELVDIESLVPNPRVFANIKVDYLGGSSVEKEELKVVPDQPFKVLH